MDGLLLVNKPKGWSSYDVIRKAKAVIGQELPEGERLPKIGHAGTLDPLAEGLMLVLFGSACKQAQKFSKLDKLYEAEITLGHNSTTDDAEGELSKVSGHIPAENNVRKCLELFKGEIVQQPPRYSAIKIGGKRAYKLAREGKEFSVPERKVTVYSLELIKYKYPAVRIEARVSSGTYIRTLARDIGAKLKTGGFITYINRLEVGSHKLGSSLDAKKLTKDAINYHLIKL